MENTSLHEIAASYVEADAKIRELDDALKAAKQEKKKIEEVLFTAMLEEGAPSVEVFIDGTNEKARVFPSSKLYARRLPEMDAEQFCARLREAGFGDLVKENVNTNSLSAVVRELAEQAGVRDAGPTRIAEALPEGLAALLKIDTTPTLNIRRK